MPDRSEWRPGLKTQPPPSRPPTRLTDTTAPERMLLVVLARDRGDFREWCVASGLSERDRDVVVASSPEKLRGITRAKIIRCPGWIEHEQAEEIRHYAHQIERRSR
ncbi:hypothetical protein [Streptomyces sp. NPDC093223]|uniref:hypothetical protein n=1 Tax=Streptomyces sp. NPDC093223 TaxID=3366033 RepID=UPI00381DE7F7